MAVVQAQAQVIECRNPQCSNTFVPKCAQHGFCSAECRKATRGAEWTWIRKQALRRDEYTCQECQEKDCRLEVHHLLALCLGGTNHLYNLLTLCPGCHKQRHRTWKQLPTTAPMEAMHEIRPEAIRSSEREIAHNAA